MTRDVTWSGPGFGGGLRLQLTQHPFDWEARAVFLGPKGPEFFQLYAPTAREAWSALVSEVERRLR